jgi:outer membrane protein TolC
MNGSPARARRSTRIRAGSSSGFESNPPAHGAQPKYDLPALIDLALSRNPDTREAWEAARAAAAGWGISCAPFYPTVRVENWRSTGLLTVNCDLADFGRRDAAARSARE